MRKHPDAKCEECPLADIGVFVPTTVPASGKSDIAFVGEAPGIQEARGGKPFMGPSGDLLNIVLKHHGIQRRDVTLTNACLCRPPDNATPPAMAIQACRPRLVGELESAGVKTAVALGNTAAQALTGRSGVFKLRVGPGIPSSYNPSVRVVTTLHPAYCLRNADGFPSLIIDIGKVVNPGARFTPPEYTVVRSPVHAIRIFRELLGGQGPLVADIETHVEKDAGFGHPNQYNMLCVGLGRRQEGYFVLTPSALSRNVWRALRALLLRRGVAAQNGKFDCAGLFPYTGPLPLKFDTLLASYACDERQGVHGLKVQAQEYLGAPAYDDAIKQYVRDGEGYGNIPPDILYKYNAYDLYCTDLLMEMYEARFDKDPDLRKVHDFLCRASEQLMFVELNGLAVDLDYLKRLAVEYTARIDKIEIELDKITAQATKGHVTALNPRSPKQVKAALLAMKISVPSTDEETMNALQDRIKAVAKQKGTEPEDYGAYNFATTLLTHRRESKLYGTYIKGTRKRLYRGRVYPTFLLHGTTTGRLSCRNPNLQNVPRESSIRDLFVPARPEHVFVQTDYSQAELRVLCWLAGDQYFRDIFNGGDRDLFDELTPTLYPAMPSKEEVGPAAWKEVRIRVKAFVYGLAYGRGAGSIADEFKTSHAEAERAKRNFFGVIPEIVAFQNKVLQDVHRGDDLRTAFGRRRRFPLITKQNRHEIEKEALAFLPQSTSSDICLRAMVEIRKELKGSGWVRNIVHDSVLAECPRDIAHEVATMMDAKMIESAKATVGDYVTFATESKIGTTWGQV